jgi:hypothetical protein
MTKQTPRPASAGKVDEQYESSTVATEMKAEESADPKVDPKPAPKPTAKNSKSVFTIRREETKSQILEFKTVKKSLVLCLLCNRKGVTIIENGKTREIRYCPDEPSVYRDESSIMTLAEPLSCFLRGDYSSVLISQT